MITRSIGDVKLASAIADELIPNIKGDSYREDNSWLATMRALLPSRLPEGSQARLCLYSRETPSKKSRAARMEYYLHKVDTETPYTISVLNVNPTTEDIAKVTDAFRHIGISGHVFAENVYDRLHSGEHPLTVMIYVNHETANSVIVVERLSFNLWHMLQGFMRKIMFKNLFDANPCTEDEEKLLRALGGTGNGYDDYMRLIDEFAKKYDFRSAEIRKAVSEMAARARKSQIKDAEDKLKACDDAIELYRERIYQQIAQRDDHRAKLEGLKMTDGTDSTAKMLTDFFLANTNLHFTTTSGTSITYWVKTRLSYWDEKMAKTYIATHSSYLYRGRDGCDATIEQWEQLLKDIFLDRKVRIKICAAYRLNISDRNIGIEIAQGDDRPEELMDYIKNPHSMYHNCWGSHLNNVVDALSGGDYIGAISATIAATAQLTINDVSSQRFSYWLGNGDEACIELPDGTCMTCDEYIKKLQEGER